MIGMYSKRGFSIVEYIVVLTVIVGTMFVFKDYIIRGITGRWKNFSDQIGYGRQYHPTDTVECAYDYEFGQGWYDVTCVDNQNYAYGNKSCKQQAIGMCNSSTFCQ